MQLGDLAWPAVPSSALLVVPLGSTEQHGPHLPLSTDTDIAVALCARLAAARPDVVIAPVVPYGSSGEHAGFPGTLSIGQDALELLVVELVRSATDTFERVLLVSAHGGNADPVARAVQRLRDESRVVSAWFPHWDGDAHAGHVETSMQLALRPSRVDMRVATAGDRRPLAALLPQLRAGGVGAVSPSGVLGDPTTATAADGAHVLGELASRLVAHVDQLRADRSTVGRRV